MSLSRRMALIALGSVLLLVGGRAPEALTPPDGPVPLPPPLDQARVAPAEAGSDIAPSGADPGSTGRAGVAPLGSLGADLRAAGSGVKHHEYVTDAGTPGTPGLTAREAQLLAGARAARSHPAVSDAVPSPGSTKEQTPMPLLTPDPASGVGVTTSVQEFGPRELAPAEARKLDHHREPARPAGEGR